MVCREAYLIYIYIYLYYIYVHIYLYIYVIKPLFLFLFLFFDLLKKIVLWGFKTGVKLSLKTRIYECIKKSKSWYQIIIINIISILICYWLVRRTVSKVFPQRSIS